MGNLTRTICAALLFAVPLFAEAQFGEKPAGGSHLSSVAAPLEFREDGAPSEHEFSPTVADRLVGQFRKGLLSQNLRRALSAFNRDRMPEYARFSETLTSLFSRYNCIRVYYRILEISTQEETGTATVEFTMEAAPHNDTQPPLRRSTTLVLKAAPKESDWKIIDLQPRGYFESF